MHDIAWIRENPEAFDTACANRALSMSSAPILDLDQRVRQAKTALQDLQQRRNELSRQIGQAKASGGNADAAIAEVGAIKDAMKAAEDEERDASAELEGLLAGIPNVPADDVPVGADESDNVELRRWGTPRSFAFTPK